MPTTSKNGRSRGTMHGLRYDLVKLKNGRPENQQRSLDFWSLYKPARELLQRDELPMIDTKTEKLFSIKKAIEILSQSFADERDVPTYEAVRQWIVNGARGGVKLDAIWIGRKRYTSQEAIDRFLIALEERNPKKPKVEPTQEQRNGLAQQWFQETVGLIYPAE